jgi:hypothetical protein
MKACKVLLIEMFLRQTFSGRALAFSSADGAA